MFFSFFTNLLFPRPIPLRKLSSLPRSLGVDHVQHFALFNYENQKVRTLIRYLKNHRDRELSAELALQMYQVLLPEISEHTIHGYFLKSLIIPVPISKQSKKKRGFNQLDDTARSFASLCQGELINRRVITKSETKKQALLHRDERFRNIANCFKVMQSDVIENRDCIIIDDLITTGATVAELKKVLKRAGARKIIVIAIAH